MSRSLTAILGLASLTFLCLLYSAANDIVKVVSPQGCRMSWMSPSYILQTRFDQSWTPLANRYSLWLYREVGWQPNEVHGLPVLFVPGNAGSSHQVRSIASSAARQYYSSPYVISEEFSGREHAKPLDFFAAEFNEDLSAFHGPTMDSQISYTSAAISYILSLYPPGTQVILMGHSMGGVVSTALLDSSNISALITMSTPHTLPPASFDARMDALYAQNLQILQESPTPVLSICGGVTDTTIHSESCILPSATIAQKAELELYRRTVFTSALEGAWTGVGHREMVWCHQVRWRVARAALELAEARSGAQRAVVLDRWLRDGHDLPPAGWQTEGMALGERSSYEALPEGMHLVLKKPQGIHDYLLPVPLDGDGSKFVLYVSRGAVGPVSPQHAISLKASVFRCAPPSDSADSAAPPACQSLPPTTLKLLPHPIPGKSFPVPDEGSDESEGVVLFEVDVPPYLGEGEWVGVHIEGHEGGWVIGGFERSELVVSDISTFDLLLGKASITFPSGDRPALRTSIRLPKLTVDAILVYRLVPQHAEAQSSCSEPLLAPLLQYTSHSSEIHYFPLTHAKSVALHTHSTAPYVPPVRDAPSKGIAMTIYSSSQPGCESVLSFDIAIDWWASAGRAATRLPATLVCWATGVVCLLMLCAWREGRMRRHGKGISSVQEKFGLFVKGMLPKVLLASFVLALVPLPSSLYLGTRGEPLFAPLAPLIVMTATGAVIISWWMLSLVLMPIRWVRRRLGGRSNPQPHESGPMRRSTVASMTFILLLIFLLIPWQVAFLGCWIIQLSICTAPEDLHPADNPDRDARQDAMGGAIPLLDVNANANANEDEDSDAIRPPLRSNTNFSPPPSLRHSTSTNHENEHILLLMTWLIPFVAPILVVWVRALLTAGYTTPFNGDHNFLRILPILVLSDMCWGGKSVLSLPSPLVGWGFAGTALVVFLVGPRHAYLAYDMVNVQIGVVIVVFALLRGAPSRS
ncbi:PGAP1-domain-containing protein [Coniophora puteana RWD-64-598 SS2]|uniref:GPI inositol-deacylase n=1 Tax=Coniophora puteana (strain RWD-64-598) TaxID=741705 RepID=A0A5M3MAJ3_CONPW|nr:PGAP1-domain-containing protein [Coniophora puteana RWD-64-598 SS2]EIW76288.1 PGAP1-domain-containing protein [Coniophora puteana RWD-64-598 SS2]